MSEFVQVGRVGEFPEGRSRRVAVAGVDVAVIKVGGELHAIKDACPHMGASLSDGRIEGRSVTCHWHAWTFDLRTGASDRRHGACARIYRVRVEGEDVWLAPPETPAPKEDDEPWVAWDDSFLKKSD